MRDWKVHSYGLGQEQVSNTPGLVLTNSRPGSLEKWFDFIASVPVPLFPQGKGHQLEWNPFPCPDPGLSVEAPRAGGLPIMHSPLHRLQG